MINKKAQFFSLYLFVLTVFMVSMALGFYFYQNSQLTRSLVPYSDLERLKLDQKSFEIGEKSYIFESAREVRAELGDASWGDEEFTQRFKEIFLEKLSSDLKETRFLLSNISFNGNEIDIATFKDQDSRNGFFGLIYNFSFFVNGEKMLNVTRRFDKRFLLRGDRTKNNIPIEVFYNIKKEYLIKIGDLN